MMPALSQYTNVNDTAVAVLRRLGFQVWYDEATRLFYAEQGGWDFAADDPIGLLGLVSIYREAHPAKFSEYWWRIESASGEASRLPGRPSRNYVSVTRR